MRKSVIATTSVCLTLSLIAAGDDANVIATLTGAADDGASDSGPDEKLVLPAVSLTAGNQELAPVGAKEAKPGVRMSASPSVPASSLGVTPKASARAKATFSQVAASASSGDAPVKARRHLVRLRAMSLDLPAYPETGAPESQFATVSAEIAAKAAEGHARPTDPEASSAFARTNQVAPSPEIAPSAADAQTALTSYGQTGSVPVSSAGLAAQKSVADNRPSQAFQSGSQPVAVLPAFGSGQAGGAVSPAISETQPSPALASSVPMPSKAVGKRPKPILQKTGNLAEAIADLTRSGGKGRKVTGRRPANLSSAAGPVEPGARKVEQPSVVPVAALRVADELKVQQQPGDEAALAMAPAGRFTPAASGLADGDDLARVMPENAPQLPKSDASKLATAVPGALEAPDGGALLVPAPELAQVAGDPEFAHTDYQGTLDFPESGKLEQPGSEQGPALAQAGAQVGVTATKVVFAKPAMSAGAGLASTVRQATQGAHPMAGSAAALAGSTRSPVSIGSSGAGAIARSGPAPAIGRLASASTQPFDDPSSKTTIVLPTQKSLTIPEVSLSASGDSFAFGKPRRQGPVTPSIGRVNTIGRDISMTAPLRVDHSPIGEIAFTIRPDDTIAINAADLLILSRPLLSRAGLDRLKALIGERIEITTTELNGWGYRMQYDNERIGLDFFVPAQLRRPGNTALIASKAP